MNTHFNLFVCLASKIYNWVVKNGPDNNLGQIGICTIESDKYHAHIPLMYPIWELLQLSVKYYSNAYSDLCMFYQPTLASDYIAQCIQAPSSYYLHK